jgi:hypothetical protein
MRELANKEMDDLERWVSEMNMQGGENLLQQPACDGTAERDGG